MKRKVRTLAQRRSLAYKRRAPHGIGTTIVEDKRRARSHRAEVIASVRRQVFERDRRCRRCCRPGRETDHMHEVVPRSQLRGLPPEEVFRTQGSLRLCQSCHQLIHQHLEDIVYVVPELGCDGEVQFQPRLWK